MEDEYKLGRKRIPEEERVRTICINLQQKILTEIEKHGNPKHKIEEAIIKLYSKEN